MKKIFILILAIYLLNICWVIAQNRITIMRTDNRGFRFYYNPTSSPGYAREVSFGISNYTNDNTGNDSGNASGTFNLPLFEFRPKASDNYLENINKNIFRILNNTSSKAINMIAIRIGSGSNDPNTYSRIVMFPEDGKIYFDSGIEGGIPFHGNFILSRLYGDIGDLIAVYSCENTSRNSNETCLGKEGVYKKETQPPGAVFRRNLDDTYHRDVGIYLNPDHCFGRRDAGTILQHICLGDCSRDDEALTFCIRTKP